MFKSSFSKKTHSDEDEDNEGDRNFKWFTSEKSNTRLYKGQYIAIWNEQIVVNTSNAVDAENIAKEKCGKEIHPLVVYIPEDEITPS